MSHFRSLPVYDRIQLLKEYKKNKFSYREAIRDFDETVNSYGDGGTIKPNNPFKEQVQQMVQETIIPTVNAGSLPVAEIRAYPETTPIKMPEDFVRTKLNGDWKRYDELKQKETKAKNTFSELNSHVLQDESDLQPIKQYVDRGKITLTDSIIKNKDKDKVREIQEILLEDNPNSLPISTKKGSLDGIYGPETAKAVVEYNKSKDAKKNLFKQPRILPYGGDIDETQCTEFAAHRAFKGVNPTMTQDEFNIKTGLGVDSWNLDNSIINAGGKKILDTKAGIKNGSLQPGDIVIMKCAGSQFQSTALKEGDGNTHSGIIASVNKDGSYNIEHNMHVTNPNAKGEDDKFLGKYYFNKVEPKSGKVSGWKGVNVVKVLRPNYDTGAQTKTDVANKTINYALNVKLPDNIPATKDLQLGVNTINNKMVKRTLMQDNNLEQYEYSSIAQALIGIVAQETGGNKKYEDKINSIKAASSLLLPKVITDLIPTPNSPEDARQMYEKITDKIKGIIGGETSKGITKIKLNTNFSPTQQKIINKTYGLNNEDVDGKKAFIYSFIKLTEAYNKYKLSGMEPKEALYNAITDYNNPNKSDKNIEYRKNKNKDYTNKVLLYSKEASITDGKAEYKTLIDDLLTETLENTSKIPSIQEQYLTKN